MPIGALARPRSAAPWTTPSSTCSTRGSGPSPTACRANSGSAAPISRTVPRPFRSHRRRLRVQSLRRGPAVPQPRLRPPRGGRHHHLLGRQDGQVKIRGMRVDLGEVEGVLKDLAEVHAGVVLNRRGWMAVPASSLGHHRRRRGRDPRRSRRAAAAHMLPSAIVGAAGDPAAAQRQGRPRALPDPAETDVADAGAVVPPLGETAARSPRSGPRCSAATSPPSAGRRTISRSARDSISAIRVVTRAAGAGLVIAVRDLFEAPTLADLAAGWMPPRQPRAPTCRWERVSRAADRGLSPCGWPRPRRGRRTPPRRRSGRSCAGTISSEPGWSAAPRASCSPSGRTPPPMPSRCS